MRKQPIVNQQIHELSARRQNPSTLQVHLIWMLVMFMVKILFSCEPAKKSALTKALETDQYAAESLARIGYTLREIEGKVYVLFSTEKTSYVKEKLKDVAALVEGAEAEKIIAQIKSEADSAAQGFGSMFG